VSEPSGSSLHRSVPAIPQAVTALRRAAGQFATGLGAGDSVVDGVRLAVSEAVTNVILHAYPDREEPGPVELTAALDGAELLVTVRDEGMGMSPRIDSPGLGLGLPLIAQTAHSLEVRQAPSGGTEMRMSFRLPNGDGA
jgi:serine/threonine-protein kinase RsbW/stage II sporulation protein AB (anti-sigma F factor)